MLRHIANVFFFFFSLEIPQYTPGVAYRQLEFLLGRVANLSEITGYSNGPL